MRKVVQLCSFESVYNEKLQRELINSPRFSDSYELSSIYFDNELKKYQEKYQPPYSNLNRIQKLIFWRRMSQYLYSIVPTDPERDILHIQFVDFRFLFVLPYIRKSCKKIIISFWGSDLLRQTKRNLKLLLLLFRTTDLITFETQEMINAFESVMGNKYRDKYRTVKFGLSGLDEQDRASREETEDFKKAHHIPDDRTIVVIGYNRIVQQQHLAVIKSLIEAEVSKEKIYIVIPWTYGKEEAGYKEKIEELLKGRYDYQFISGRLSDHEVACLRKVTDVLVQVQTTDSFSATMLETLYEKKTVITGSWLPYDELIRKGITMAFVNDPEETGRMIAAHLEKPLIAEKQLDDNRVTVRGIASWDSNLKDWIGLYDELSR